MKRLRTLFLLMLTLLAANAFAACYDINTSASNPLNGTPFSACSISGSTITCSQSVTVSTNNVCITTNAAPLIVNMSGQTFNWNGNSGVLGTSANPINLVMGTGTININGNSFTSYGDWSGKEIKCSTNPQTAIYGTLAAASTNTCSRYVQNLVSAPTVVTFAASSVTSTGATLNGTVNPNSATTTVSFGYSNTGGSYTSTCTPTTSTFSGNTIQTFTCNVSGLTCGATYYFRATGTNSSGTTHGSGLSFTPVCSGADFDAYETSYMAPTATSAKIKTHVASGTGICVHGGACSLKIGAFTSGSRTLSTSFTGPVKLEIVDASSGVCSTYVPITNWVASQMLSTTGETTVTLPAVANAYANARIRISYPATGTATSQSCSSDNFAIRPTGFTVTATDATVSTAGSTRSLTSGANTHKAGQPFTLNVQAYVTTSASIATNYVGAVTGPVVAADGITTTIPSGAGLVNGTLSVGAWSITGANTGSVFSNTATYSEVGTITLKLEDQHFADVDGADSTNAERYISGTVTGVGRFTPDHFVTAVTKSCGSFTYSGQPFSVMITAYNGLSTPGVTKNYALTPYVVTVSDAGTATHLTNNLVSSMAPATTSLFSVATGTATATPTYTFNPRATAPTPITVHAVDADMINSDGYESSATNTIVSGRIRLLNAYGSDRLALPLVTKLEYYDTGTSAGWRPSSGTSYADTCTSLTASNFAFATTASNCTVAISTCISSMSVDATLSSGLYKSPWFVYLGVPTAAGNTCVALNLDGAATGNRCTAIGATSSSADTVSTNAIAGASWLKYPWTGTTATNPTARAAFGIYKSPLIYRRENY